MPSNFLVHDDNNPGDNGSKTTGLLRVSKSIYDEVVAYQKEAKLPSLRDAADQIYFNKLAGVIDPQSLKEDDEKLTPFKLAVKHVANPKAIDALLKTARLDVLRKQSELLDVRIEKAKNGSIQYVDRNVFVCPACRTPFDTADAAVRHFNEAHPAPVAKAIGHTCPYCVHETTFDAIGSLRTHINAYHKVLFQDDKKPAVSPPPSPIPPLETKVETRTVEVTKCYCGASLKTDADRMTHPLKCAWLKSYVEKNAQKVAVQ